MNEKLEHKVDRTGWLAGPWDSEADRYEWRSHGFPCLIIRNDFGALCGYVGVPPTHRFYKKDYSADDYELMKDISVHGGLTYSNSCRDVICHVPQAGELDEVWWLGFDCAHAGDLSPKMDAAKRDYFPYGVIDHRHDSYYKYRDVTYVKQQVEQLAQQLSEVK